MALEIPPGSFEGHIFDLDGTLIDSMPLHLDSWNRALRAFKARFQLTPVSFMSVAGVGGLHTVQIFNQRHGADLDPEAVWRAKEAFYLEILPQVRIIPEVVGLAHQASAAGLPIAIASGGTRDVVSRALEVSGLSALFSIVCTQDEVMRSKPAPDLFLLAAERMGVAPERCLVYEDSLLGIEGARSVGMATVRIPPGDWHREFD